MGTFLKMMSGTKLKKYREMKDYTSEQMKQWLFQNLKLDEIVELCSSLILDELNTDNFTPITITQEEFEKHFRIRKPQQNPMRNKKKRQKVEENM